ncbi:MAG: hypothetical protein J5965_17085 [Aeriscardovia sp.]|nr:hypothetical protein [Aeriscardovia sp.]
MKKIIFAAVSLLIFLSVTSCTNDDIVINTDNKVNDVNVTVSLSNFFQSYNYNDTYHGIEVSEYFRTFYSEYEWEIQTRTLIYDSNGLLVDSLVSYSTNTNAVTNTKKLGDGKYTFVSTLTFAFKKDDGSYESMWDLADKENLATANLQMYWNQHLWSIMSYDAKEVTIAKGQTTDVNMQPSPIGALAYMYLQNFCYKNEADYPNKDDNGIRLLALFSRNKAVGYKLNPKATDKYVYLDATGSNSWYYLSSPLEPSDFSDDWTFFQSNLFTYFYILGPNPRIQFGYVLEGEDSFHGYGEQTCNLKSGEVYLAYWDYFKVGNPYFGLADNNHWNKYNARAPRSVQNEFNMLPCKMILKNR